MTQGITDPARVSPEAIGVGPHIPLRVTQVTWSSPLHEPAAAGRRLRRARTTERATPNGPGNPTRDLIRVAEQCASGCAANGDIPGLVYRSQDWGDNFSGSYNWRASASYVTGAHSLKVGYQGTLPDDDRIWYTNNQNLTYRLNNGVPNQLTQSISPWIDNSRAGWHALFAQEQWTLGRLTLQGALRFDRASSWFPEQQAGPSRFLPTRDHVPRDEGRRQLQGHHAADGRGLRRVRERQDGAQVQRRQIPRRRRRAAQLHQPESHAAAAPLDEPFGTAGVTRTWTDANGNFQPDCDLLNPLANDRRGSGGDFCGQISNLSFGQNVLTDNYDPALLTGWGVRASDWSLGVSVQQQILPRDVGRGRLHRRWFNGFTVNDNLLTQPSDYTPYSVTAPLDPRLPGGGGYVISGLYDVSPALAGQINNLVTDSQQYGELVPVFQRRGRHVERADAWRPDVPGRHQHRPERGRQLRGQGEPAGAQRRHRRRPRRLHRQHRRARTVTSATAS